MNLHVAAGEIVGIGGLDGQGQRELLHCLYGLARAKGAVTVGRTGPMHHWGPKRMRDLGVAFVPADRGREGLLQRNSIALIPRCRGWASSVAGSFLKRAELGARSTTGCANCHCPLTIIRS